MTDPIDTSTAAVKKLADAIWADPLPSDVAHLYAAALVGYSPDGSKDAADMLLALAAERDEARSYVQVLVDRLNEAESALAALQQELKTSRTLLESEGNAKRHYLAERDELKEQLGLYRRSMEMLCGELDQAVTALALLSPTHGQDETTDVEEP